MQLQILFSDDSAWMNFIDSRFNKVLPVEIARSKSIPLYFILDNGEILGGGNARNWYFGSYTDLENLKDSYFGNLLDFIHSQRTFVYKGEEKPAAYLATWLYDTAEKYLQQKSSSVEEIDEIAIAGFPAWSENDLKELQEQLNYCKPTKIMPLCNFFMNSMYVALPVNRKFEVGEFKDGQWHSIYSSPIMGEDIRIRSMANRMVESIQDQTSLNESQSAVETLSCEAYLKWNKVLQTIEAGNEFRGSYRGISKRGMSEILVQYNSRDCFTSEDQRKINAVAINSLGLIQKKGITNATVELVGDGYGIPAMKRPFEQQKAALRIVYTSTEDFLNRIFLREWGDSVKPGAGTNTTDVSVVPVSSLTVSSLSLNDVVYLHGADVGKQDSDKALRYLGGNRFETLENTRGWSQAGDTLETLDSVWHLGQKIRLMLEKLGKVAVTRTIKEIKAPVRNSAAPAAPKPQNSCGSAFEVATDPNVVNLASLAVGSIVSLHGVDPAGAKAPSRKELRYLGNNRFETLENTRGWSRPGDILVAMEDSFSLNQCLRFKMEKTGQVATTRMIDSLSVR